MGASLSAFKQLTCLMQIIVRSLRLACVAFWEIFTQYRLPAECIENSLNILYDCLS